MSHFQMMFAASILLRWFALLLVQSVREPNSHPTMTLVVDVVESISRRGIFLSAGINDEVPAEIALTEPESPKSASVPPPRFVEKARSRSVTRPS